MKEITYTTKEIIGTNKDGTPNYGVWRYTMDSKTKILLSIKRLR